MITEIEKKITEIKDRDPFTEQIIACAYSVHSELGPGFSEKIYRNALMLALKKESLKYETENEYKVTYQAKRVGILRMDFIVEDKILESCLNLCNQVLSPLLQSWERTLFNRCNHLTRKEQQ